MVLYRKASLISELIILIFILLQVFTQAGIEWGLSPVGRIAPKEWRE